MSKKKKTHSRQWTSGDVALLKTLLNQGKTTKQIAKIMKRTEPAIHSRKTMLGLHTGTPKKGSHLSKGEVEVMESSGPNNSLRKEAKDLTSVAREIARKNGKRVTMAMFFIEDL